MTVTGSVRVDLTAVPPDRWRHRVAALDTAPDGARCVLVVGALVAVDPRTLDLLCTYHRDRLLIDVQGEPHAVRRWIDALRSGDVLARAGWCA